MSARCRWCMDGLPEICGHRSHESAACLAAYAERRYDDICDDCYDELTGDA